MPYPHSPGRAPAAAPPPLVIEEAPAQASGLPAPPQAYSSSPQAETVPIYAQTAPVSSRPLSAASDALSPRGGKGSRMFAGITPDLAHPGARRGIDSRANLATPSGATPTLPVQGDPFRVFTPPTYSWVSSLSAAREPTHPLRADSRPDPRPRLGISPPLQASTHGDDRRSLAMFGSGQTAAPSLTPLSRPPLAGPGVSRVSSLSRTTYTPSNHAALSTYELAARRQELKAHRSALRDELTAVRAALRDAKQRDRGRSPPIWEGSHTPSASQAPSQPSTLGSQSIGAQSCTFSTQSSGSVLTTTSQPSYTRRLSVGSSSGDSTTSSDSSDSDRPFRSRSSVRSSSNASRSSRRASCAYQPSSFRDGTHGSPTASDHYASDGSVDP